jgi:uncharacterized membrane protein YoaK (UPF0700 family)
VSPKERLDHYPGFGAPVILRPLGRDPRHGPLPLLLLALTLVTGLVDAVSILRLGRVFVANMTGNVVFTGFALAGAPGFSLAASLSALAGFLIAAAWYSVLTHRIRDDRALLLVAAGGGEVTLVAAALTITAAGSLDGADRSVVAGMLALAMGIQNAAALRVAVPGMTTTVLTTTLTGIAADLPAGNRGPALTRRVLAVVTMLAGAMLGAWLVLNVSAVAALGLATCLLVVVTIGVAAAARRPGSWQVRRH